MLATAIDSLLSVLYPQACHCCGGAVESRHNGVACDRCWSATRLYNNIASKCRRCGAIQNDVAGGGSETCSECSEAEFDSASAAGVYERALAATVWKLKHEPYLSPHARSVFENSLEPTDFQGHTLIVPVPQSRKRELERGYNQAEILAKIVSRRLGVGISTDTLVRSSHTPTHRAAMDRKARAATVERSFEVKAPRLVNGGRILLVDDVLTSGSTASSCAKVLKKNGASRVDVVTLARAVMHSS